MNKYINAKIEAPSAQSSLSIFVNAKDSFGPKIQRDDCVLILYCKIEVGFFLYLTDTEYMKNMKRNKNKFPKRF